jgi:hypothetical protein
MKNNIVYSINIEDVQNVAEQELDRELTPEEVKLIASRVGDYISWYDVIALAIDEKIVRANK